MEKDKEYTFVEKVFKLKEKAKRSLANKEYKYFMHDI